MHDNVACIDQHPIALGNAFDSGWGTTPNFEEAVRWYMDADLDWNAAAMVSLGALDLHLPTVWRSPDTEKDADGHWTGPIFLPLRPAAVDETGSPDFGRRGLAQDKGVAIDRLIFTRPGMTDGEYWLKRAVHMGSPAAKTALGTAKLDGVTMPLDVPTGLWLLNSAACSFDRGALLALSRYWSVRNPFRSWVFAEIAAREGQVDSKEDLDRLNKALSPRQIARAKQIAQDWCAQN